MNGTVVDDRKSIHTELRNSAQTQIIFSYTHTSGERQHGQTIYTSVVATYGLPQNTLRPDIRVAC